MIKIVRINLVHPSFLMDQHLIAEYNEILMLFGYVKKHPAAIDIPESYRLGKGHIKFFKDKLLYLKLRHETIKIEMQNRGYQTNKTINLDDYPKELCNFWVPKIGDLVMIRERIKEKLKQKPDYYTFRRRKIPLIHQLDKINYAY